MSDTTIGWLVALNLLPHTWKVLWAPVADITFSRKRWYLGSNLVSSVTLLGIGLVPIHDDWLGLLQILVFLNSLSMTFLGMAVEGLMAHTTPLEMRGRAAGWFQGGNLGGSGLGGGIALILAKSVSPVLAGVVLAAILLAVTLGLRKVPEVPRESAPGGVLGAMKAVGVDLWKTLATRNGALALILCFLPLGAGAAAGLFSAIAGRWHASAEVVAAVNGIAGGIAAMFGALLGGRLSDAMSRRVAYALSGALLAVIALGMALAPQTEITFAVFTLLYTAVSGLVYGTFTGFVLEVIGKGAAATKYNALASLSNIPITYMTVINANVSENYGPSTMLLADAGAGVIGLAIFVSAMFLLRPPRPAP